VNTKLDSIDQDGTATPSVTGGAANRAAPTGSSGGAEGSSPTTRRWLKMRKFFEFGGVVAAAVLFAFGIGAIVISINGRDTVHHSLGLEQIVGTPDMTPGAIAAEAKKAGLTNVDLPTTAVAGKPIDSGARARVFAQYMRIHALEATGGYVYAQMGMYVAKPGTPKSELMPGGGTSNAQYAQLDSQTKQPVANGARNVWVTETALTTALNTSYMAEQTALFGIVVGIALLLSGIGFAILAIGGALRNPETALLFLRRKQTQLSHRTPAPTV
jgi:hypothetical protein